jgi:hypothetical protein
MEVISMIFSTVGFLISLVFCLAFYPIFLFALLFSESNFTHFLAEVSDSKYGFVAGPIILILIIASIVVWWKIVYWILEGHKR